MLILLQYYPKICLQFINFKLSVYYQKGFLCSTFEQLPFLKWILIKLQSKLAFRFDGVLACLGYSILSGNIFPSFSRFPSTTPEYSRFFKQEFLGYHHQVLSKVRILLPKDWPAQASYQYSGFKVW